MTDDALCDAPPPAGLDAVLRRMIAAREAALGAAHEHIASRNRRIDELDTALTTTQAALDQTRTALANARRTLEAEIRHIVERNQRIAELDAEIAARDQRIETLEDQFARLRRLADDLVWPDGPRALRAVLPLARLVRKVIRR
jgi:predicted RNase H-like nuclease (RuvC/YqgF family)